MRRADGRTLYGMNQPTLVDDRIARPVPVCRDADTRALVLDFLPGGGGVTVSYPRSHERVRVGHALLDWALSAGKS